MLCHDYMEKCYVVISNCHIACLVNAHATFALQENDSGTLDTVGAVVVDHEGNVAAAVSSGGLALKHPGRVGQVSNYGVFELVFQVRTWIFLVHNFLNQ